MRRSVRLRYKNENRSARLPRSCQNKTATVIGGRYVFEQAVQLPEHDRATLAGLLIETLDPLSEGDVEAAWSEEIERRLAEIDAGTVELIPWEDVRAELSGESE